MNDESKMIHGGDRYRNQVQYDFSVNINPLGIPQGIRKAMQLAAEDADKYPDIRYEKLRAAIGKKHGISPDAVICGNGASELLSAVLLSLRPKRVFLPVPSFYGYERAAFSCGGADYLFSYERGIRIFDPERKPEGTGKRAERYGSYDPGKSQ